MPIAARTVCCCSIFRASKGNESPWRHWNVDASAFVHLERRTRFKHFEEESIFSWLDRNRCCVGSWTWIGSWDFSEIMFGVA